MSPLRLLVLTLTAAVALAGCQIGALKPRTETKPAENLTLKRELIEARQRVVMAEVEAERLTSKVAELERELQDLRSQSQQAPRAQDRGQVIADRGVEQIALKRPDTIEEEELEEPTPPPARPVAPRPAPGSTPTSQAGSGESAQTLYDRAYSLFHEKRYSDAETAFKHFLSLHSESHLADNAQFWIGESRWARGDFSSALSAFMATVEKFPHGNKVADALLKAGRCLEALGQKGRAIATYEELMAQFPSSAAALSAQQRLAELPK